MNYVSVRLRELQELPPCLNDIAFKGPQQIWLYKKVNMVWKLSVLLLLGICGICICLLGVEQKIYIRKSRVTLGARKVESCSGRTYGLSNGMFFHYPQPLTYDRKECMCTPVHYFVILTMQRTGSGWVETLLNNHPNISSHGEVFAVESRHESFTTIKHTLDRIYSLDWYSSSAKNACTAAVGFKWMLNQGAMEYYQEITAYLKDNAISVIFLFRRNILKRYVSILANIFDRQKRILNGTHQAHVHSRMEADLLAAYKPMVDLAFLPSYLHRVEAIKNDALFYFNRTRHVVLYYEDLVKDPEKVMDIQKFLGVDPREVKSHLVKIHTKPLPEQIQNWQEVHNRLKDTEFKLFLKDTDYM